MRSSFSPIPWDRWLSAARSHLYPWPALASATPYADLPPRQFQPGADGASLCQDEVAVQYGSALPQIPPPHTSVLTDRMQRLFRQLQLGNPIDANVGIGEPVHVSFLLMMFSQIAERFWFWIVALRGADVGN